jgi:hypothetical protein
MPTFAPTPASTNWTAPNDYPPDTWTPYSASPNSVWNTPFQQSPAVPDPNSLTYQRFYTSNKNFGYFSSLTFGYTDESNQYGHPIYFGYATDPVYTVKCLASWADVCPPSTQKFHIPKYAVPAGGSDAHLTSIDYTYNPALELDCWSTTKPSGAGGVLTAQACGSGAVTGQGLAFGQTAAGYAQWAGVIRASELTDGYIGHALFVVAPCTASSSVYPSISRPTDTLCPSGQGAPYGFRIRLNMTPQAIAALSIPQSHKTILTALSSFGAYQGDTNGNNNMSLQVEADEMYTAPNYVNPSCGSLPSGAPCTPLTAWANGQPGVTWTGANYNIDISKDVPNSSWQWLLPPTN